MGYEHSVKQPLTLPVQNLLQNYYLYPEKLMRESSLFSSISMYFANQYYEHVIDTSVEVIEN